MRPTNLLYICSDQHNRAMTGCYGHPLPVTPHLDALAARGTRFTNAYTPSPICMPARACLAAGRYVHQLGAWDNAHPYCGEQDSWHHRLRAQGLRVDCIGKLHFRGDPGDDHGFTREHFSLYRRGAGDVPACQRGAMPKRTLRIDFDASGPGDSSYLRYDRRNVAHACEWIAERGRERFGTRRGTGRAGGAAHSAPSTAAEGGAGGAGPWALFLGIGCPHTPFIAPPELYARFDPDAVPLPPGWHPDDWPQDPALRFLRERLDLDTPFPAEVVRRANAAYLGLCAFVDGLVGQLLDALEASGQAADTRVVYTTDHGESMGARGVVGKFTMYDESAAVPLLLAGPDVPEGHVCATPVSLVDTFPTALQAVGAAPAPEDADLPGQSWWEIAAAPDADRTVLSEYHALASRHAVYMLRDRRFKYVHYHNDAPQLFAAADTAELHDLAADPEHADTVADFGARLRAILDPDAVDRRAKADQARYAVERADAATQWPPPTDGPTITYTTIPPELDPALEDDPAARVPGWKPTRDMPDLPGGDPSAAVDG